VIICSCNVLSEEQVLETLQRLPEGRPRSVGEAYRCLGCAPRCGRCLETVRKLVAQAHLENCNVGCPSCPAAEGAQQSDAVSTDFESEPVILIAAE
jgi:bacterioferritin-associated ferredoxin